MLSARTPNAISNQQVSRTLMQIMEYWFGKMQIKKMMIRDLDVILSILVQTTILRQDLVENNILSKMLGLPPSQLAI